MIGIDALATTHDPMLEQFASLREMAYERIRRGILGGQLSPGQPISVQRLADALQISRTPVREALAVLHAEGLVEMFPSRGTFVSRLSVEDLHHLFELREALEGMAARLAAERGSDDDLVRLSAAIDANVEALGLDPVQIAAVGSRFHVTVADVGGNPRICKILADLSQQANRTRVLGYRVKGRPEGAIEEHRQVLEAIQQGNGALAEQRMRSHIRTSQENVLKLL